MNTPNASPPRQPTPKTILLVEDDKATLMVLRKMLQQEGYRVLSANGGEEGLTIATQQQNLDLLVTDVIMPKLNGTELAKRIRAARPELPVLFISGLMQAAGVLGGQHRNQAFLCKPIVQEQLATKVQRLLRGFE
jgi:two-component system, cell cycle sensor histidine kinase and response regulator CckA